MRLRIAILLAYSHISVEASGLRVPLAPVTTQEYEDAIASETTTHTRDLQSPYCPPTTPAKWHPNHSVAWSISGCVFKADCDSPGYASQLECCAGAYGGQMSGACLATGAPTSRPQVPLPTPFQFPLPTSLPRTSKAPTSRPQFPVPTSLPHTPVPTTLPHTQTPTSPPLRGSCAPEWQAGAKYVGGSLASKGCQLFKCRFTSSMPILEELCNQVGYEPLSTAWGGAWQHAWESLGDCCGVTSIPTVAANSTSVWYAEYGSDYSLGKCTNALPLPPPGSRTFFTSQLECCTVSYGAQVSGACIRGIPTTAPTMASTTAQMTCTPQWYVRSDGKCVMSCEEEVGEPCGGLASSSDLLFGRRSECPSRPSLFPAASPSPTILQQCCSTPLKIPSKCEVDILIDMMEVNVLSSPQLLAQWTRAAFHDAGTYDQAFDEGGANGCLLNDPLMLNKDENSGFQRRVNPLILFEGPLFTLQSIKNDWINHPRTCLNISSADILQFAIFFATTRQKDTPESLLLPSGNLLVPPPPSTAVAKRETLKNEFLWGRPDETKCNPEWAENLPSSNTFACNNNIPCRCATAGGEIEEKMMKRNGFTAEEATALIGAHTIGLLRNIFGPLKGPWVENGRDETKPSGPVFDNAYHDFLVNSIPANDIPTFAATTSVNPFVNTAPFKRVFPNWFRTGDNSISPTLPPFFPEDLQHLDTDITLAFPPLSPPAHPDYSIHTNHFAKNNTHFLDTFFKALKKMGTLGVHAVLSHATECKDLCNPNGRKLATTNYTGLSIEEIVKLIIHLGNATAYADTAIARFQATRLDEIDILTTHVSVSPGWHLATNQTSPPTAKPSTAGPPP